MRASFHLNPLSTSPESYLRLASYPRCRDETEPCIRHHIHQQSQRTGSLDIEFALLEVTRKIFHGARSGNLTSGAATLETIPAVVQIQSRLPSGSN